MAATVQESWQRSSDISFSWSSKYKTILIFSRDYAKYDFPRRNELEINNRMNQPEWDDPTLGFKLALNELLRYPHLNGSQAIGIARRSVEVDDKVNPSVDYDGIKKS